MKKNNRSSGTVNTIIEQREVKVSTSGQCETITNNNNTDYMKTSTSNKQSDNEMSNPTTTTMNNNSELTKEEIKAYTNQELKSIPMVAQIMIREGDIVRITKERFRFGLLKGNRPIDHKRVVQFTQIIKSERYENCQAITVVRATNVDKIYDIVDFEGNKITDDERKNFLIVADGQHRVGAFIKYNLNLLDREPKEIPSVYIAEPTDLGEFIYNMNIANKGWTKSDKISVVAVTTNSRLFHKISSRIADGYNGTFAVYIYTGIRINSSKLDQLLKNGDLNAVFGKANFNEEEMIKFGDKYINTCLEIAGMTSKTIGRRFWAEKFNDFKNSTSEKEAFKALSQLTFEQIVSIKQVNWDEITKMLRTALSKKK